MWEIEIINRLLIFIEKNYTSPISSSDLENISHYSYRNIQRIFKKIFNETIGEFQKRLKLENGYKLLIYSNDSISDIAHKIGYENNQVFTKAFKKKYEITPKKARDNKENVFKDFFIQNHYPETKSEIVYLKKEEVYFKLILTNDYDNSSINSLWDSIYEITNFDLKRNYYGIILDQPLIGIKSKSRYEACFSKKDENIKGYGTKTILEGKYQKYEHIGTFNNILETYQLIYFDWLYHKKYTIDSRPIIEQYIIGPVESNIEDNYITYILVPIK